jgi:hypothetical protein
LETSVVVSVSLFVKPYTDVEDTAADTIIMKGRRALNNVLKWGLFGSRPF